MSTEMVTEEESRIIKNVQGRTTKSVRWLPLAWSVNLIKELRSKKFLGTHFKENVRLINDQGLNKTKKVLKYLYNFEKKCCFWGESRRRS